MIENQFKNDDFDNTNQHFNEQVLRGLPTVAAEGMRSMEALWLLSAPRWSRLPMKWRQGCEGSKAMTERLRTLPTASGGDFEEYGGGGLVWIKYEVVFFNKWYAW